MWLNTSYIQPNKDLPSWNSSLCTQLSLNRSKVNSKTRREYTYYAQTV
jgi:hypothetical protein